MRSIEDWAQSEDRWWRRAALVSTVALNVRSRGGEGDIKSTLTICEMLVEEYDDMIVKALSWDLRELVVLDPPAVEDFLSSHQDALAGQVKREVRNKIETGLKKPQDHPHNQQIEPPRNRGSNSKAQQSWRSFRSRHLLHNRWRLSTSCWAVYSALR